MRINNNMMANNAHRQLSFTQGSLSKSMEKLSSGYRINRAGDDAAGLAISEKMRAQIRGLNQASRNSQDGISLIQTAEGALNETHSILQRMRELAVQASSDTNVTIDRQEIQKEINQLTSEINRIGNTTEFNTMKLLNGERDVETTTTWADAVTALKASAKTYDVNFATNVTKGTGMTTAPSFDGANKITIDKTEPNWSNVGATQTATSTILIRKDTDGELDIDLSVVNSAGATVMTVSDTITANSAGDYVYNANGVSFTISAEDYTAMGAAGAQNTLTVLVDGADVVTAGEKATKTDYTSNTITGSATADYATITSGITIDASISNKARKLVISATGSGIASTGSTVNVYIQDSAGNNLSNDKYTYSAGFTVLDYNNHGVKFTFDLNNATAVEYSKDLDTSTVVTQASSSTTVIDKDDSLTFQVGANEAQSMTLTIDDMRSVALGISSTTGGTGFSGAMAVTNGTNNTAAEYGLDVTSSANAGKAITTIDNAIKTVSSQRAALGAVQNRLEHTISNLDTSAENLQSAESRIRDVDMAKEMMEFTRNNILSQAANAMLAQANQLPQNVLQLLR